GGNPPNPGGNGPGPQQPGGYDRTLEVLQAILEPEQIEALMQELDGYSSYNIMFQGVSGRTLQQLNTFITQNGFQMTNYELQD
ncbi:hypothetical protein K8I28_08415, partial [bacterium]|nr:hypothetical protein [bacterium]